MLKEFVEAIAKLTSQANEHIHPKITAIPGDPRKVFVSDRSGVREMKLPPDLRSHTVAGIGDLLEAYKVWCGEPSASEALGVFWHDSDVVTLVIDDFDRRDRVTMPLEYTQQFARIKKLAEQPHLSQREAVNLFRHDLKDCGPDTMLPALRKLEFKRKNDGSRTFEHGKESLGRSIELQVTGASAIDEYVTFRVPLYKNPGVHLVVGIQCSIELDSEKEQIIIKPLPDQINTAVKEGQAVIHGKLSESGAAVFFGSP